MKNKTRILVPIDFSSASINGLKTARDIARSIEGELLLLHVMDKTEDKGTTSRCSRNENGEIPRNPRDQKEATKKRKMEHLRGLRIQYHDPKIPMDFMVKDGLYTHGLEDYLHHHKIDLIVTGTSEGPSNSKFFTGNNAEMALNITDVPVLEVHNYTPLHLTESMLGKEFLKQQSNPIHIIKDFAELNQIDVEA
jgi:nucleotide-binding universal stress UspA family protein